jgi:hypothetical protein
MIGFILIAALTSIDYHPVYVNGKPFANAVVIQGGILAIPLEDFAKAVGAPVTLEPTFTLQGNRLSVRESASGPLKYKELKIVQPGTENKVVQPGTEMKTVQPGTELKIVETGKVKINPGQIFIVQHPGVISSGIITQGGKAFIPLDDVRRALGDGSVRSFGNLKPGEAIRLNFTRNQNSIIAILIGL